MDSKLCDIVKYTDVIPATRNYWLVRSMGGDYYSDFRVGNFIGIGYDLISLKDVKFAESKGNESHRILRDIISERYAISKSAEEINPNYAAAQLLKFATEIKENDVVIVPGRSGDRQVSIGIVMSKIFETSENNDECPFVKRIQMKWVLNTNRSSLNPSLQLVFNSRHIVSNINHYSQFIDSASSDFYRKDDNTYLVLKVNQEEDISATDFLFLADLIELVKEYAHENSIEIKPDDLKIKVYMQSPGDITFFSLVPAIIMFTGLIVVALNGGGIKIEKLGLDISTKGIFQNISEFLDRKEDRTRQKALTKKLEAMKIEDPQALLNIIKELKNDRESY